MKGFRMNNSQRIAWITGANKGIGAALTEQGAERKVKIAASSRKNAVVAAKNIYPYTCDVQSVQSINNCYNEITTALGAVDILINNAGVATFSSLWETSVEEADAMFNTNLRGMWLCTKAVLPAMIERRSGIIVNIHSVAAVKTFTNCSIYTATKAGALAMSRSLREEIRGFGIKVIDILPGATETDIWGAESRRELSSRMMKPSDIATIIWQAIDLSSGAALLEEIVIRPQFGDL